jgi:HK97 gp10 family phage protein
MIEAKITGLPDLRKQLAQITPKLRVRALRQALAAGARVVRDAARAATPVISPSDPAVLRGVRKPGTVRDALTVRTSKAARRRGDVGVFVSVKPAAGARFRSSTSRVLGLKIRTRTQTRATQRGARSPNDPFYWRFLNFGTRKMSGRRFMKRGADQLQRALQVFYSKMPAIFERLNKRQTP